MAKIDAYQDIPTEGYNPITISAGEGIAYAAKKSGRGAIEIGKEFWRLSKGPGKLSITEYITYQLYDSERYTPEEKARFVSESFHWQIVAEVNDMAWFGAAEDKWLAATILEKGGIATPQNLAVIDKSPRGYGPGQKLATAADLKGFLTSGVGFPLFMKPVRANASFGAVVITGADDQGVQTHSGESVPYETFLSDTVKDVAYLLQPLIENHAFIREFTPYTATIRVQNLITDEGIKTPFAVLKIPANDNIADNYWRKGNIVCNVDVTTGEITSALTGEAHEVERHTTHPASGKPLVGETLPFWAEVLEVNRQTVNLFHPLKYQSLDIALTPDGPIVIEVNSGGAMILLQLASGKGFLTDEHRAFFKAAGCKAFDK